MACFVTVSNKTPDVCDCFHRRRLQYLILPFDTIQGEIWIGLFSVINSLWWSWRTTLRGCQYVQQLFFAQLINLRSELVSTTRDIMKVCDHFRYRIDFQLQKHFLATLPYALQKEGWKIFHLADTRRKENCSIPADIQAKHK